MWLAGRSMDIGIWWLNGRKEILVRPRTNRESYVYWTVHRLDS